MNTFGDALIIRLAQRDHAREKELFAKISSYLLKQRHSASLSDCFTSKAIKSHGSTEG